MNIYAITNDPQKLVTAIDKAIKEDRLKTWGKVLNSKNETLYTHTKDQWDEKAMLKPVIYKAKISFDLTWWNTKDEPDEDTKGFILGRFTEMLMVHFKDYFEFLETHK
jgi:hypothetical protein